MTDKQTNFPPKAKTPRSTPNGNESGAISRAVGKAALRQEFAAWLVSPERKGTQSAWAKAHDVDRATVSDWKRHPDVQRALAEWREPYKSAFGEVVGALHRKAKGGHVPAARTLAEILGEFAAHKIDQTVRVNDLASFLSSAVADLPSSDASKEGR